MDITMDETVADLWDFMLAWELATEQELQLAAALTGYNEETLNNVLYIKTGYRNKKQYLDSEIKSFDEIEEELL